MKVYTSYYSNPALAKRDDLVKVAISLYLPRWKLPYKIDARIKELAPVKWLLEIKTKPEYKEGYYHILKIRIKDSKAHDLLCVLHDISFSHQGKDLVLLCFENIHNEQEWCHRRMFADWWEAQTGEIINEI